MTLVVANKLDDTISIVSDTAISHISKQLSSEQLIKGRPTKGVLKAIIVRHDLCICFAGTIPYGVASIRELKHKLPELDLDGVIAFLLEEHRRFSIDARCDFIIASLIASVPSLHRIKDGQVEKNLTTCWIGSLSAFEKYQEQFHNSKYVLPKDFIPLFSLRFRMTQAMEEIIEGDKDDSVGGFKISVWSIAGRFHYAEETGIFGGKSQNTLTTEFKKLQFGVSTAQGGYSYTLLTPERDDIAAVAIYIYQPRLGIFFHPLEIENAVLIKSKSHQEFVADIETKYTVKLIGNKVG